MTQIPDFLGQRHPVLAVACPSCQAKVGVWCKRPSGHKAFAQLHAPRKRAADLEWERHKLPLIIRNKNGSWSFEVTP